MKKINWKICKVTVEYPGLTFLIKMVGGMTVFAGWEAHKLLIAWFGIFILMLGPAEKVTFSAPLKRMFKKSEVNITIEGGDNDE